MAVTVYPCRCIADESFGDGHDSSTGAQVDYCVSGVYGSNTDSGRRIVSASCGNDGTRGQSKMAGNGRRQGPADFIALQDYGQLPKLEARRLDHRLEPAALAHIQPGGAGGVGHIGLSFPGESQPQVILRRQDTVDGLEDLRLVLPEP